MLFNYTHVRHKIFTRQNPNKTWLFTAIKKSKIVYNVYIRFSLTWPELNRSPLKSQVLAAVINLMPSEKKEDIYTYILIIYKNSV